MLKIDDATVSGGKLELADLPFEDGQHVRVLIEKVEVQPRQVGSIHDVRQLLRGRLVQFEEPFEPMIPAEDWESLK